MTTHATPLEWKPLWDAMDAQPNEWIETTSDMWWAMLSALPPRAQSGGRFLVGEPLRHINGEAVHACFWEREDGRYFARNMTVAEFRGAPSDAAITAYYTDRSNGAHAAKAP